MKAFIVLSSGFKDKNQDEMIKELQEHVTRNTAEWMCPERVIPHQYSSTYSHILYLQQLKQALRNWKRGTVIFLRHSAILRKLEFKTSDLSTSRVSRKFLEQGNIITYFMGKTGILDCFSENGFLEGPERGGYQILSPAHFIFQIPLPCAQILQIMVPKYLSHSNF